MQKDSKAAENSEKLRYRKIYIRNALACGVPCGVIMGVILGIEQGSIFAGLFGAVFCGVFFGLLMAVRPTAMQTKAESEKKGNPAAEIETLKFMRGKAYVLLALVVPYLAYRILHVGLTQSVGLENLDVLLALLLIAVEIWDIRSSTKKLADINANMRKDKTV